MPNSCCLILSHIGIFIQAMALVRSVNHFAHAFLTYFHGHAHIKNDSSLYYKLVAARHLFHFGYDCVVVYPKRPNKKHFIDLVKQCEDLGIKILDDMPIDLKEFDTIVDAVFGFSFKGEPREPFKTILSEMFSSIIPVISVDVPSGWNVDEGDINETGYMPEVLISLTTPKKCSKMFNGRHFIGGRFLPPK